MEEMEEDEKEKAGEDVEVQEGAEEDEEGVEEDEECGK